MLYWRTLKQREQVLNKVRDEGFRGTLGAVRNDNFVTTVTLDDGSVCSLTYTVLGSTEHAKEGMDMYADGKVGSLDDGKRLTIIGGSEVGWESRFVRKDQLQELEALAACLKHCGARLIPLGRQLQTTAIGFEVAPCLGATA